MTTTDAHSRMRVYAHRGASVTLPENTLAAFEEALRLGADGIELDVHGTRDGVPVVSHDATLLRALGIDASIPDRTAAELREIAPSIPTFSEVVALVAGRCHLDVEIKQAGVEEATLAVLSGLAHHQWAISSFDWDVLREIRRRDPEAELWVLCQAASPAAQAVARDLSATTLAVRESSVTRGVVEEVSASGRQVMAWTVNDPVRAQELATAGVAVLCTDDPDGVMRGLRQA